MRQLLAAALAVMLAATAQAAPRVLVVTTPPNDVFSRGWYEQAQAQVAGAFALRNVEYWTVPGASITSSAANDALRRGMWSPTGVLADTIPFTAVVHLGFCAGKYGSTFYKPDNLTLKTMLPKVPQVYIGNTGFGDPFGYGVTGKSALAFTGANVIVQYNAIDDSAARVYKCGEPWKVYAHVKAMHYRVGSAVYDLADDRGWRPLLGWYLANGFVSAGLPNTNTDYSQNLDYDRAGRELNDPSYTAGFSSSDTVVAWALTNTSSVTGLRARWSTNDSDSASFSIFCSTNGKYQQDQPDVVPLMVALNLADSVSNHGVWGANPKRTDAAIHVDDGWKRGAARGGSGGTAYGAPDPVVDTLSLAATTDSLRVLGRPFVLGVELDSLTSVLMNNNNTAVGNTNQTRVVANGMLYDGRWWGKCAPYIHYTPHCHAATGSGSSAPAYDATNPQNMTAAGNASPFLRPLDIWGRYRGRWAWGSEDSTVSGHYITGVAADGVTPTFTPKSEDFVREGTWATHSDTGATYWLAKRAFTIADSVFGAGNVDHFGMPPNDDYSSVSTQTYAGNIGQRLDSTFSAYHFAGGRGIRYNGGSNQSNGVRTGGNQGMGYYTDERRISANLGRAAWVPDLRKGPDDYLIGCGGYMTSASRTRYHLTATLAKSQYNMAGLVTGRAGWGSDFGSYTGTTSAANQVFRIYACHVSDLCAATTDNIVTRPGWYGIKYFSNMIDICNSFGVELFRLTYPEKIRP